MDMSRYLKKTLCIVLYTLTMANHGSQQPASRVQTLQQLAMQELLSNLKDLSPIYYQNLRSGQSFTQAKKSIYEQPPIDPLSELLLREPLSSALYKKYEPAILNVIFNKPLLSIDLPNVNNFGFDDNGRYFFYSVAHDNGEQILTRILVGDTSDIASGKIATFLEVFIDGDGIILSPTFNPDSTKLYAAFSKKAVALDLPNGNLHTFAQLPDDDEDEVAFYENFDFIFLDGKKLYAYIINHDENHRTFGLASIEANQILKEIDYIGELQPEFMGFEKGSKKISVVQNNNSVWFIDPITLAEQTIPAQAHPIRVTHAIENMFFMGDEQGNITILDLSEEAPDLIATLAGQGDPAHYIGLSSDGHKCAVSFENSNDIALYNIQTQQKFTLKGHIGTVDAVEFTPDDKYLISTSQDGTIQVWDVNEKTLIDVPQDNPIVHAIATITGHSPELGSLHFFREDNPDVPFYIFTCQAPEDEDIEDPDEPIVGEEEDIEGEIMDEENAEIPQTIRIWFMPKQNFFNFNQILYLLSMAKLLDNNFLKTFETKKQYDTYIDGLMDFHILKTFPLSLRQNFITFLEEQKAKKIAPAMTARSAEAP